MADTIVSDAIGVGKPMHKCGACGVYFVPKAKDRTKFCGRECGLSFTGLQRKARTNGARVYVTTIRARCKVCRNRFDASHPFAAHCTDACRQEGARQYSNAANAAKHVVRKHICAECNLSFVPEYGDKRRKYCSDACAKRRSRRSSKQTRRAERKGCAASRVDAMQVFARDGWRCQLCNRKTPQAKRGTYAANAPELDHIMPLSLGGEHTYANTQCACRSCNAAKGAKPMGQLLLWATP